MDNNHEVKDLTPVRRVPWNKGKLSEKGDPGEAV